MIRLLKRLLRDEQGAIISSEVVLVGTILVLGSLVGLAAVSWAVNQELNDVANAVIAQPGWNSADQPSIAGDAVMSLSDSPGQIEVAGY